MYPELPLKGNTDEARFKLYYPDTGLLVSSLDDEAQEDLRVNKNLGVYKGALYENFVAEAFIKQGLGLYYFKKENSQLEEDFFVRSKSELIPIEVKSGDRYTYSSLNKLRDKYKDYIDRPIIIHTKDLKEENGILYLPIYMTCLL